MDEQDNPQANGGEQSPRTDDAALRELALALIAPRNVGAAPEDGRQLLPGQLPPDFASDFPLPPGARVVGSLVAPSPVVVLDTEQAGEDVVVFYQQQLTAAGWSIQDPMRARHGGFLHAGMVDRQYGQFYREDGPSLAVMTYAMPGGRTSVHLTLTPDGGAAMAMRGVRNRQMRPDMWQILPPIAPPPHSEQFQEGGSGGDDRITTSARVESDLDLTTLAAHYIAQLERAGWQRTDSGENGPVAWNTWTFEDEDKEPWRALFVLVMRPDVPRQCWAHLLAEWRGQRPRDGVQARVSLVGWQAHTQVTGRP